MLFNPTFAFSICEGIIRDKDQQNFLRQQGDVCTRCKNGSRRGNFTKEPVLLQNGDLSLTSQDIQIPGRGISLDITRIYNSQLSSTVDGWAPEDGSGSWLIENLEYSGDGGEAFSKYSYQDAVIEADVKTVTAGEFDNEVATLYFRFNNSAYYYFFLIHTDGSLELSKIRNGRYYSLVQQPSTYNPLEWNRIRIITSGSQIQIYVNDNLEIDYTDTNNSIFNGRVALVSYNSHAHFDNVSIVDGSTIIQSNDFENNANGWTPEQNPENWNVEQGEYSGENGRSVSDVSSLNTTVILQMKTVTPGTGNDDVGWINFRYQNPSNRYYFYITQDKQLVLGSFKNGNEIIYFQGANPAYDPLYWNNIKISAIGGDIRVWINELLVATAGDGTPLPEGKIALEAKNSHVHFDNVSIRNGSPSLANDFNLPDLTNDTAFGNGWTFTYETKIFEDSLSGSLTIRGADGAKEQYVKKSDGSFAHPRGIYSVLTKTETGYTLREKNGTLHTFDLNGNLISITDRNNNQINISYTDVGGIQRPQTITEASGRQISLEYNANGKLSKVTYPAPEVPGHREINYIYDGNNLIEADYPSGYKKLYTYYSLTGNLHTYTDPNNYTTTYNYSYSDKVLEEIDPGGNITSFFYSANITSVENNRGEHVDYEFGYADSLLTAVWDTFYNDEISTYDDNHNLIRFEDKLNRITDYEYDPQGNRTRIIKHRTGLPDVVTVFTYEPVFNQVTSITDPRSNTTQFIYEPTNGNLLGIIDPVPFNFETTMTYDEFGNLKTVTDARGNITEYFYDPYGNRIRIVEAKNVLNYTTYFTYDVLSELISTTDANNNSPTTYEYDRAANLIKTTDSLGNITRYAYDGQGNRLTQMVYLNNRTITTSYAYDWANNLIRQTNPDNTVTTYTYDLANFLHLGVANRLTVTDANSKTTTYEYDSENRLTRVTDPQNHFTRYFYEYVGTLASITDANQNNISYDYDDLNRLTYVHYPNATNEFFTYDDNGNLTSKRKQNGDIINYAYDNLNRMTSKTYPDNSSVTYQYDSVDNLTNVTDATGTIINTYNEVNRLTQIGYPLGYTVNYTYDPVGNRRQMIYPHGAFFNYSYDALNRLAQIKDYAHKTVADYSYDALSRRTQLSLGNTTTVDYQYTLANQLRQISNYKTPRRVDDWFSFLRNLFSAKEAEAIEAIPVPFGTFSYFAYTYDKVGNRLTQRFRHARTPEKRENYNYDSIYQLISTSGNQQHSYDYDNVGNRELADGTTYTTNNMNEYTNVGGTAYQYDQNGNLTNDGVFAYTYDYENRLITAIGNGHNATYAYDPFGRRINKAVDGVTTNFIYDGDRIIEERDTNSTVLASYVYGEGIDEILTMHRDAQKMYYHYDGLGSVTTLTDTNGNVVENYTYDVYGQPSQLSQIGNRFYFAGRELDEETGIYYYRARYYSPTIGRFLQKDKLTWGPDDSRLLKIRNNDVRKERNKIEDIESVEEIISNLVSHMGQHYPQSLHAYLYARNNPINLTDPYGLYTWPYTWKGWAGVVLGATGAASLFVPLPGARLVGYGLMAAGGLFMTWDAAEGFNAAIRDAKKVGKKILDRDREEWEEIDRQLNINKNRCGKKRGR